MAVSLRRPDLVRDIIAVDNAPVEAMLSSSFGRYMQAMRRIEDSNVQKQSEADAILKDIEPVCTAGEDVPKVWRYLTFNDFFFPAGTRNPSISSHKSHSSYQAHY